jgi:hypothetical protein
MIFFLVIIVLTPTPVITGDELARAFLEVLFFLENEEM